MLRLILLWGAGDSDVDRSAWLLFGVVILWRFQADDRIAYPGGCDQLRTLSGRCALHVDAYKERHRRIRKAPLASGNKSVPVGASFKAGRFAIMSVRPCEAVGQQTLGVLILAVVEQHT